MEGEWASFPWCPGTDCMAKAVFTAPDNVAGPLGDTTPSSRGGTLSRPRWRPRLCLGRPPLCRPVGLAHGLDRARLRRLSRHALGLGPKSLGLFKCAASPLAPGPLGDAMTSRGGSPQDYEWRPSPGWPASVGRVCAGQVGLAHCLDRARLLCLSHLAFGSELCPKLLGSFKCVSERTGGVVSVARCPAPDSLSSRQGPMSSSIVHTYHSQPHSHVHPPRAPPTRRSPQAPRHSSPLAPTARLGTLAGTLAPTARPSHQDVLPARLRTRQGAHSQPTRTHRAPLPHDVLPARLRTRQGVQWHPRCPTHGRRENSEPIFSR